MTVEQEWFRPEGREVLVPGTIGPRRPVPAAIERPEYVGKDEAVSDTGPYVQSADVIARVREASRIAALALQAAGEAAEPGVTTDHIDAVVHDVLIENGAYPSPHGRLGVRTCAAPRLHPAPPPGSPHSTVMQPGAILNVAVTAYIHGVHGDCNATFPVGEVHPRAQELVDRAHEAMMRGIRAARPG